jgi:hypothetical protein
MKHDGVGLPAAGCRVKSALAFLDLLEFLERSGALGAARRVLVIFDPRCGGFFRFGPYLRGLPCGEIVERRIAEAAGARVTPATSGCRMPLRRRR